MNNGNEVKHLRRLLDEATRKLRASAVREIELMRECREIRRRLYVAETELHIAWEMANPREVA